MGLTILAVIFRIFSNSLSNVYQKQLTQEEVNAFLINFIMYLGLTVLCIPFLIYTDLNINLKVLVYAVSGGLFGALGNSFLVKALEKGELSILGPINAYKAVAAMIFGIILLKEIPSLYGIIAIILIIAGSYLVFDTQTEGFSVKLFKRKDIRYRFYALIFTAIEAVLIKNVILLTDIKTSFFFWCFFGMLFTGLAVISRRQKCTVKNIMLSTRRIFICSRLLFIILCMGIMQMCTNYVFEKINVSYGLALFQLSTILSVILGWHYFKEKQVLKKLTGSTIMVLGAVILILVQ